MQYRINILAIDFQIGQHDVHVRVVVPGVAWCSLDVPFVFARIRIYSHDRTQEQVVAAVRATHLDIPWPTVTGTEDELVVFLVVSPAMPGIAAAAVFPPPASPGLGRHFLSGILEAIGRVARDDIKAPDLFARLSIVSGYITAHRTKFRSAITYKYFPIEGLGMAGNVQRLVVIEGPGLPDFLAVFSGDRNQPAVPSGNE